MSKQSDTKGTTSLRVIVREGHDAIQSLREAWCALQAECPNATPFQTWEWCAAWERTFGRRKRVCVLLFYEEGTQRLCGIAPLTISRHIGTPLRRLAWAGTGVSDYLGFLALPSEMECVSIQFTLSLGDIHGWDFADLQQVRSDSPLMLEFEGDPRKIAMEPCPYLVLPDTWDAFLKPLGKKLRTNLNYYERLLHRTFEKVEFSLADDESLNEALTALFALHQKRWNARWLPGVLGSERVQGFHREVARLLLERGCLRLHLLRIDGRICAALYCFHWGDRTFYYLGGFDPEMSKYSLGTLLNAKAIRYALEEGDSEFDFLRGDEGYKYRWEPQVRVNQRLIWARPHALWGKRGVPAGRAGVLLNRIERYVEHRAKEFAARQGRKTSPKKNARGVREETTSAPTETREP